MEEKEGKGEREKKGMEGLSLEHFLVVCLYVST